MTAFVLTVTCATRRGIVAAISGFLAAQGCNITDAAQFDDTATGRFFARITFRSETGADLAALRDGFAGVAEPFDMVWAIHSGADRMKVLLMVSNFGHCLNDLLYRWRIGALPVDIVGVVSNHLTYQKLAPSSCFRNRSRSFNRLNPIGLRKSGLTHAETGRKRRASVSAIGAVEVGTRTPHRSAPHLRLTPPT